MLSWSCVPSLLPANHLSPCPSVCALLVLKSGTAWDQQGGAARVAGKAADTATVRDATCFILYLHLFPCLPPVGSPSLAPCYLLPTIPPLLCRLLLPPCFPRSTPPCFHLFARPPFPFHIFLNVLSFDSSAATFLQHHNVKMLRREPTA